MYLLIPQPSSAILHDLRRFTSHYVSINSELDKPFTVKETNLHPTMYLLIRSESSLLVVSFTYLHPTMYLLILNLHLAFIALEFYLHPTMYLLIPAARFLLLSVPVVFTSHYVSINSQCAVQWIECSKIIYIPLCTF